MEPMVKPPTQPKMGIMDILKKKPEPFTMYSFVLMILAVFVGAYFYFSDFSRALGKQLNEISNSLYLIQAQLGIAAVKTEAAMEEKKVGGPYVNEEAGFSLVLPKGYQASGDAKTVVVAPEPTAEDETPLPVMWVNVYNKLPGAVAGSDRVYAHGGKFYVLSLHEGLEWQYYDAVADSLAFTK